MSDDVEFLERIQSRYDEILAEVQTLRVELERLKKQEAEWIQKALARLQEQYRGARS